MHTCCAGPKPSCCVATSAEETTARGTRRAKAAGGIIGRAEATWRQSKVSSYSVSREKVRRCQKKYGDGGLGLREQEHTSSVVVIGPKASKRVGGIVGIAGAEATKAARERHDGRCFSQSEAVRQGR